MLQEVFQDEVIRATDLNRSSGEVLNKAAKAPLTIIRNDEVYALMRRDVAGRWRKEAGYALQIVEIISRAVARTENRGSEFQWIDPFDDEDRLRMTREITEAYLKAVRDGTWDNLETIIHEWSESGWAALDPDIRAGYDEAVNAMRKQQDSSINVPTVK